MEKIDQAIVEDITNPQIKNKYNIAQNQSFVQIEIGSKIEPYEYSPISEILLFL